MAFGGESDPLGAPRLEGSYQAANPMQTFIGAFNFGTNLIDNWIDTNLKVQQSRLNMQQAAQRGRQIDQEMTINQQKAEQASRLYPLELQGEQQKVKISQFNLDSAQQEVDRNNKAYEQVGPLRDAIKGIDKDDPNFDQKIADLENKYPDAFTSKATASMVVPFINELSQRRSASSKFQLAQGQKETLKSHISNGFLPGTVNPDDAVSSGQAEQLIDSGNRQATTQRLQKALPYMTDPREQTWAQNEIKRINGSYGGGGESIPADPTAMTPKGELNPASDAVLSSIERKYNLVAKPPGPTKDVTTKQYDALGNVISQTTVKGVQATAADEAGTNQPAPVTTGVPSTDKIISSKAFQGVMSDVQTGKLKMPEGMVLTSPEGRAWLKGEYLKRAVETGEQVPGMGDIPGVVPPNPESPAAAKKKSDGLSDAGQPEASYVQAQPNSYHAGREGDGQVQGIILHSSDGRESGDINQLTQGGVSSHYYVTRSGKIYQFVDEKDTAYHAGKTVGPYNNSNTVGIEQEHFDPGGQGGQEGEDWPDAQVQATARLTAYLENKYGLTNDNVRTHSQIAPERKQDPYNFPFDKFYSMVGGSQTPASKLASSGRSSPATATSNNDYTLPEGAVGKMGIPSHVWQNVMSEEGPEVGYDKSHPSVFGLWGDTGGMEGAAYRRAVQSGPRSLAAYNAVTNTWINSFLPQSQPWKLDSPGMQELVIADSQHRGGDSARSIIDAMGGWNAINSMDPQQAVATYSELRKPLWPANEARVIREREWALRNALPQEAGQLAQR